MSLRAHLERWFNPMLNRFESRRWKGPEPKTHDYTNRYWGHDFAIHKVDGLRLDMSGWGDGLEVGDFLILPNNRAMGGDGARSTTRYRVESVRYTYDPPDMWFVIAVFAPRQEGESDV